MSRLARGTGWALVSALALVAVFFRPSPSAGAPAPALALLGPVRGLLENWHWIRFQEARVAGDQALALVHAERALELAPESTAGWQLLASHVGFFLSSDEREPSPEKRLAWLRAAVEVTRRGQERAKRPDELALLRGILLLNKADLDPEIWPAGRTALLREAEAAFGEAHSLGSVDAEPFGDYTRELLEASAD